MRYFSVIPSLNKKYISLLLFEKKSRKNYEIAQILIASYFPLFFISFFLIVLVLHHGIALHSIPLDAARCNERHYLLLQQY